MTNGEQIIQAAYEDGILRAIKSASEELSESLGTEKIAIGEELLQRLGLMQPPEPEGHNWGEEVAGAGALGTGIGGQLLLNKGNALAAAEAAAAAGGGIPMPSSSYNPRLLGAGPGQAGQLTKILEQAGLQGPDIQGALRAEARQLSERAGRGLFDMGASSRRTSQDILNSMSGMGQELAVRPTQMQQALSQLPPQMQEAMMKLEPAAQQQMMTTLLKTEGQGASGAAKILGGEVGAAESAGKKGLNKYLSSGAMQTGGKLLRGAGVVGGTAYLGKKLHDLLTD